MQGGGVPVPREVVEFFNGEPPDIPIGVKVDISEALEVYNDRRNAGLKIDLQQVPHGVRYVLVFVGN